jgi:DNA repair exonuclease SbcCD ATPase subunit
VGKRNLQERVGDLSRKTNEYQRIIEELSAEIKRLNDILKAKLGDIGGLELQVQGLTAEVNRLEQLGNSEAEYRGKLDDYENKLALLSQELERLNGNLKEKINENVELIRKV